MAEETRPRPSTVDSKPHQSKTLKINRKNLSYGVLSSPMAVESVHDHHRNTFSRSSRPQLDGSAFVSDEVRGFVRPRDCGDVLGSSVGRIARAQTAPLATRKAASYSYFHTPMENVDFFSNRVARAHNRRILPLPSESVSSFMWTTGSLSSYGQHFPKPSKQKLERPRPVHEGNCTQVAGYSHPKQTRQIDEQTKVWMQPDLCARHTGFGPIDPGSGVAMTSSIVRGSDFRSTAQGDFRQPPPEFQPETCGSRSLPHADNNTHQQNRRSCNAIQIGFLGVGGVDRGLQNLVTC